MINPPIIDYTQSEADIVAQLSKTRYYLQAPDAGRDPELDTRYPIACEECGLYFGHCSYGEQCHADHVVYVDGACLDNGKVTARSGVGISYGCRPDQQMSFPITDIHDPDKPRTNQRAELLAAIYGLSALRTELSTHAPGRSRPRHTAEQGKPFWIVAMDSEYVVKSVAEYMPKWERRNWKTTTGKPASNVDLFQKLRSLILECEKEHDIHVKFWWIERAFNSIADDLAAAGAAKAFPSA